MLEDLARFLFSDSVLRCLLDNLLLVRVHIANISANQVIANLLSKIELPYTLLL